MNQISSDICCVFLKDLLSNPAKEPFDMIVRHQKMKAQLMLEQPNLTAALIQLSSALGQNPTEIVVTALSVAYELIKRHESSQDLARAVGTLGDKPKA